MTQDWTRAGGYLLKLVIGPLGFIIPFFLPWSMWWAASLSSCSCALLWCCTGEGPCDQQKRAEAMALLTLGCERHCSFVFGTCCFPGLRSLAARRIFVAACGLLVVACRI